jgi:triosephosphate isomerase
MIAGNWKMNTSITEAKNLVKEIQAELIPDDGVEVVLCPPFVSLEAVKKLTEDSRISLGAQNIYCEEKGAYTGEISPLMLIDLCQYVIIGHSERRQYFYESGELISKKVLAAVKSGLRPILCVGENLKEYEAGQTREVVTRQLSSSMIGVDRIDTLTIAYEPVWAIGTGRAATGKQADETIGLIRSLITSRYGASATAAMRILYGGSVTSTNIAEFVSQPEIDGALVGGASLKAREFANIVKITSSTKNINQGNSHQ